MHHVFLIPGFFGFSNFGDLKYFAHVHEVLEVAFANRGQAVTIYDVATLPTASLTRRAAAVATAIDQAVCAPDDPLHLIGHSTGGLDARLFCSPGARLPFNDDIEPLARRVRTAVSVASPHYGAPQASLFTSLLGQSWLRALSILTLHGIKLGSMPLPALVALAGALPSVGRVRGPVLGILEQVYRQLLKDFDEHRRDDLHTFFAEAVTDQALLPQLSEESMQIFNAATTRRPSTRYGCVVTQSRPPSLRSRLDIGLSPSGQAIYSLYAALYELASTMPRALAPSFDAVEIQRLTDAFGDMPTASANDAIVPTLSQVFGDIVHAVWADHHDVIGHFDAPEHDPAHIDWLSTQTNFSRRTFDRLWTEIVDFILDDKA